MRNLIILLVIAIGLYGCSKPSTAIKNHPKLIAVLGQAEVMVEPDHAELTLTIKEIAEKSAVSRANVVNILTDLKAQLIKQGVDTNNIKQAQIFQGKQTRWQNGREIHQGYFSQVNVVVKIEDLGNLVALYDIFSNFNQIKITETKFKNSKEQEIRQNQAKLALKNAKDKAGVILSAVDKTVGQIVEVTESGAVTPSFKSRDGFEVAEMASHSSQPGFAEIKISASVSATFEIR